MIGTSDVSYVIWASSVLSQLPYSYWYFLSYCQQSKLSYLLGIHFVIELQCKPVVIGLWLIDFIYIKVQLM